MSNLARAARYDVMTGQLQAAGRFDLDAIAKARDTFDFPANGGPEPRRYEGEPWRLPFPACRVVAAPIGGALGALAMKASRSISALFPDGVVKYMPPPESLHCTVFHPSSPQEPSPLDAAGLAVCG